MNRFLHRVARRIRGASVTQAPPIIPTSDDPAELLPGIYEGEGIRLARCRWRFGHMYHDQALVFLCHVAARGAAPIVEFGTFDGRTTYNLALNLPEGQVFTIDAYVPADTSNVEEKEYGAFIPGQQFLEAPPAIRERIVFLRQDSRTVDLTRLNGRAGLVIVDGGHSHEVCANDTRLAMELVRPGGVVVWDDYTPYWPGVKDTLDNLARQVSLTHYPRLGLVVHVSAP